MPYLEDASLRLIFRQNFFEVQFSNYFPMNLFFLLAMLLRCIF